MSFLGFIFLMLSLLVTALLKSLIGYFTIMMMIRGIRLGFQRTVAFIKSLPARTWAAVRAHLYFAPAKPQPRWTCGPSGASKGPGGTWR
jgi:hypothetical protein